MKRLLHSVEVGAAGYALCLIYIVFLRYGAGSNTILLSLSWLGAGLCVIGSVGIWMVFIAGVREARLAENVRS